MPIAGLSSDEVLYLAIRVAMIVCLLLFLVMVVRITVRELAAQARSGGRNLPLGEPAATGNTAGVLAVIEGGRSGIPSGTAWPLISPMTIGRRDSCDVRINDPFLSSLHAEIIEEGGEWWIRDVGSTNGTVLNGTPVAALTMIRIGDIVELGDVRLQVARA
ncbi:MAG: FHA domain-containing protein [Chloroflexota bacterium]